LASKKLFRLNRQSGINKREGAGGSLTRIHPNTVTPDADARTAYEVSTPRKKFFEVAVTRAEYADLFAKVH